MIRTIFHFPDQYFLWLISDKWQFNIFFQLFSCLFTWPTALQSYCMICDDVFWIADSFVFYIYWHDRTQPWLYESQVLSLQVFAPSKLMVGAVECHLWASEMQQQSRLEERAKILKVLNILPSGATGKRCTEAQINSLTRFTPSLVTEDSKSIITHQCEKNKRVKNVLKVAAMNPEQPSLNWADITFGRCLPWYTLLVYIRVVWLTWDHNKLITACSFIYKKHGRHKSFATMNNWNSYINCVSLTKQNLYMEHKTNMVRTAAGVCFSCRFNICLSFPTSKYWTYIKVHQSFKTEDLIFWPFVCCLFYLTKPLNLGYYIYGTDYGHSYALINFLNKFSN